MRRNSLCYFPILLYRDSTLTKLIIMDLHIQYSHSGKYFILREMKKVYFCPKIFSKVKNVLQACLICRRLNRRTIKLNQSPYRDFRVNPPDVVFKFLFLDFMGPYTIKFDNQRTKCWILCLSCIWSRCINLKVYLSLSVHSFLLVDQI